MLLEVLVTRPPLLLWPAGPCGRPVMGTHKGCPYVHRGAPLFLPAQSPAKSGTATAFSKRRSKRGPYLPWKGRSTAGAKRGGRVGWTENARDRCAASPPPGSLREPTSPASVPQAGEVLSSLRLGRPKYDCPARGSKR